MQTTDISTQPDTPQQGSSAKQKVIIIGSGPIRGPGMREPEPKTPIYMAVMAFNRLDPENLSWYAESVVGQTIKPDDLPLLAEELRLLRGNYNVAINDIQVAVEGLQATATVQLTLHNRWVSARQIEKVSLRRADKNPISPWLIAPDNPITIFADEQAGLIQRLATCLAYPEAFISESRKRATISNIKALILGLRQFVFDYDGKFDLQADDFRKKLQPYLGSDTVFTAPTDPPGTTSYTFNPNLVRVDADGLDAAKMVILYEEKDGHLNFAYDGKAIVGFLDGHTEFVTPEQAPLLQWKP